MMQQHKLSIMFSRPLFAKYCKLPIDTFRLSVINYGLCPGVRRYASTQARVQDRVSGTWYIPQASNADPDTVVSMLPQLLQSKRQNLTTAIFFATPSIAQWFAPSHNFLQSAMNHIYRPVLPKAPPISIVAIVDALPSPKLTGKSRDHTSVAYRGAEGLSLCLLSGSSPINPQADSTSELPLVHFYSTTADASESTQKVTSASLQVANTLFVNGSKSTLLRHKWAVATDARGLKWEPTGPAESLNGLRIPVDRSASSILQFDTHLQVMTKARTVMASMGNVVREIEGDDGATIKASTELETMVPEFLRRKQAELGPGRAEVYALLMPPKSVGYSPEHNSDTEVKQMHDDHNEKIDVRHLIRRALWQGGRLHKVTGGGGGWGKKAGLLSLDTSTNFESTSRFEISMFPSFDEETGTAEPQTSLVEEAIPLGWSIQFLTIFIGPEQDPLEDYPEQTDDPSKWTAKRWSWNEKKVSIAIGTIDAKDEHISRDAQYAQRSGRVTIVPNLFGMLSPSGICLAIEDSSTNKTTSVTDGDGHQFRVDAPQTSFHATWKALRVPKDLSEVFEAPKFESGNEGQTQVLGSLMEDALKQSRKPPFRKVQFQPRPKFEIPASKQKRIAGQKETRPSKPARTQFRIIKYKS